MTELTVLVNGSSWAVEVEQHLLPGKGHDRYLVADDFLGVADGATPLRPEWPDPGPFAAAALAALRAEASAPAFDVHAVFERAIRRAGSPGPTVSCAVAITVRHGDRLTVAVLGDCTATLRLADGRSITVTDPAVRALDAAALGGNPEELQARFLDHRLRMNQPGSYWILADQPAAAEHVTSETVPADLVTEVVLETDGHNAPPDFDDSTVIRAARRSSPRSPAAAP